MRTTPWLTLFVHSWCLNHLPIQEMGTKHIQFRINWVSRHTASCWHATGLWPLYAHRRNTTGCFVWMLSTLDLTTLLSGEAWRINSHRMDFPTSPTIHSSHSLRLLFLSCTTCCLISASRLFDLFPLSNGIFIILEKRLPSPLSLRFLLCTDFNRRLSGKFAVTSVGTLPSGCRNPCSSKRSCHLTLLRKCVWRLPPRVQRCMIAPKHFVTQGKCWVAGRKDRSSVRR